MPGCYDQRLVGQGELRAGGELKAEIEVLIGSQARVETDVGEQGTMHHQARGLK